MIIISDKAKEILEKYKERYSDYKTPQEFGRSAFWNWRRQISNNMNSLDREDLNDGDYQTFSMNYWGDIIYGKFTLPNNQYIVVIEDFKFDDDNFQEWLNHDEITDRTTRTKPNAQTPMSQNWHTSGTCTNGFQIVWYEDEYNHTMFNYSYDGKIVYTKNDGTPMTFTKVTDFKNNTAYAHYYKWQYVLKSDGECVRLGNTDMMPHKERNVTQAEYNYYKRYGLGDNTERIGQIISETINNYLVNNLQMLFLLLL
ncbi:MAG: hypothetical protein MJZ41_13260 [Bacteroidaceae bacterium]|nr:hypothetical protein [Bacteroidaceae bacterium]